MTAEGILQVCCGCDCAKKLFKEIKEKYPEVRIEPSHTLCANCIQRYYGKDHTKIN